MFIVIPLKLYDKHSLEFSLVGDYRVVAKQEEKNNILILSSSSIVIDAGSRRGAEELLSGIAVYGGEAKIVKRRYLRITPDRSAQFHVRMERQLLDTMKGISDKHGIPINDIINFAVIYFLAFSSQSTLDEYLARLTSR